MGIEFLGFGRASSRGIAGLATGVAMTVMGAMGASAGTLYINDSSGQLGMVDVSTGEASVVGSMGVRMTDIAFAPNGDLYGIDFNFLYGIDSDTGATTRIGKHNVPGGNGLVFGTDGTLYGAGFASSNLYSIDTSTGSGSLMFDMHHASGGDLAFNGADLYMASTRGELISINTSTAASRSVGSFGVSSVYGIATDQPTQSMFAVGGSRGYRIDPATGKATLAFDYAGSGLSQAWGQAFRGESSAFGGGNVSAVPLPAGLPLMVAALASAGWVTRRKRSA